MKYGRENPDLSTYSRLKHCTFNLIGIPLSVLSVLIQIVVAPFYVYRGGNTIVFPILYHLEICNSTTLFYNLEYSIKIVNVYGLLY